MKSNAKLSRPSPYVVDWDGDGKLDLLTGNFYSDQEPAGGNVWLFLRK